MEAQKKPAEHRTWKGIPGIQDL